MKRKESIWEGISKIAINRPLSFLKHVNINNYLRLKQALRTEPKGQILDNLNEYIKSNGRTKSSREIARFWNLAEKKVDKTKKTFILISHEATRTGAPLIILKLGKEFHKNNDTNVLFLLCKGGELEVDFTNVGPTLVLSNYNDPNLTKKETDSYIKKAHFLFGIDKIYVNSAESRHLLPYLNYNNSYPIISLVHELGNYYPKGSWEDIDKYSDKIVFPANYVKVKAFENYSFDKSKLFVQGQGLLKPEILKADKVANRALIRKELNIPPNSTIILGCGSTIARKGIDLFTFTAISVLNQLDNNSTNNYFIWIGDAPYNDTQKWTTRAIVESGWGKNILFIGSREDTIPYFTGSDIFFLTSRGDPYPCVVHEALAAGLPIVGFTNSGGWVEAVPEEMKHEVPHGDISMASDLMIKIVNSDNNNIEKDYLAKLPQLQNEVYADFISHL